MRKSYKRRNVLFLSLVCLIGISFLINKLNGVSAYEPEVVSVEETKETEIVSSEEEEITVVAKTTEKKLTPAKSNGITDGVIEKTTEKTVKTISGSNKEVEPETLTKSADKADKKVKEDEVAVTNAVAETPAVETPVVAETPVVEAPVEVVEVAKADFNDLQMDIPDAPPTPAPAQESELVIIDYSDRLVTDSSQLNGDVLVIE